MNTTPIERYNEIKEFVDAYCEEHRFTEEERQTVERIIMEPARKEVVRILVSDILNNYLNSVLSLLPSSHTTLVKHTVHHVKVGKAVLVHE